MQPRYIHIKTLLLDAIEAGDMRPGDQVPSENQLAQTHGVSRMTARRALSEMVDEGILMRSQGVGTFVSDHRPMSSMLEIKSIRDEIEQRGHRYTNHILVLETLLAGTVLANKLAVNEKATVFRSVIVHCENTLPVQYEERWVNPMWLPDYLEKDLTSQTANFYLNEVAPLSQADNSVEAVLVNQDIAKALIIKNNEPCLKVSRRTFTRRSLNDTSLTPSTTNTQSTNSVVSYAELYHPGSRYRLGGHLEF
ncbi:UTRA domain-containing protein [Alteromonas sp. S167]|uniref:UTRA domain-containing protein n=1 Tax=Alteromonas sp. S167 TaxID=3117402 RepID=UPI002FE16162